jgi:hypothetical protein
MDTNSNSQEPELVQQVSPEVVYQQDKAAIDVQISTAKSFPRNIKRATDNAIAIVTIDTDTAKTCTYSVPRGGKAITGPSVHLAKILAQVWGNLRIEAKVVDISPTHVTSEAVCFDLENNLAVKTQVKRSIMQHEMKEINGKWQRTGRMVRMNEDMITVTGNAANSIALRNAILSVIPRAIVDKVYNNAKHTITGDVSDDTKLIAKRKQVVDALKDTYNVTEAEILKAIGKAALQHITADDLVVLIGIGTAIRDGDTTVDQAFKGGNGKPVMKTKEEAVHERISLLIDDAKTLDDLKKIEADVPEALTDKYIVKLDELTEKKK